MAPSRNQALRASYNVRWTPAMAARPWSRTTRPTSLPPSPLKCSPPCPSSPKVRQSGCSLPKSDIATLNNLLTDNNEWRSTGQGETGELLLTGEDRLLRCQSRFLIENPDGFIAHAKT